MDGWVLRIESTIKSNWAVFFFFFFKQIQIWIFKKATVYENKKENIFSFAFLRLQFRNF